MTTSWWFIHWYNNLNTHRHKNYWRLARLRGEKLFILCVFLLNFLEIRIGWSRFLIESMKKSKAWVWVNKMLTTHRSQGKCSVGNVVWMCNNNYFLLPSSMWVCRHCKFVVPIINIEWCVFLRLNGGHANLFERKSNCCHIQESLPGKPSMDGQVFVFCLWLPIINGQLRCICARSFLVRAWKRPE